LSAFRGSSASRSASPRKAEYGGGPLSSRTTGQVSLAALKKVIEQSDFRHAGLAQNLTALERGYEETTVHTLERRITA